MLPEKFISLTKKARAKNAEAMQALYSYYWDKLYGECFSILKNRDDAYDTATDVLLKLFTSSYDVEGVNNPDAFMWVSAKNASLNLIRKRSFSSPAEENSISGKQTDEVWYIDVLSALTENEREILILHISWGFSLKEMAKQKKTSLSTIRRGYKSAKEKIKELYKQEK